MRCGNADSGRCPATAPHVPGTWWTASSGRVVPTSCGSRPRRRSHILRAPNRATSFLPLPLGLDECDQRDVAQRPLGGSARACLVLGGRGLIPCRCTRQGRWLRTGSCERGEPPGLVEMSDVFTDQEVLVAHANARLNLHGRRLLVSRVIEDGRPVAHVAKELGVSRQCAHRWVARFRAEGDADLADRSSRPHRCPRRTTAQAEQQVLQLRRTERRGQDWIGSELGLAPRTVSAILRRHQVCRCRLKTEQM